MTSTRTQTTTTPTEATEDQPGRAGRRRRPCAMPWSGHGLTYARPYPCGWRCDRHSPWALAHQPEPQPGPGRPATT